MQSTDYEKHEEVSSELPISKTS